MIKNYLLGIISILGLGLSFSSASFPAIGMTSQLSDGNTCVINEDLSINCEKSNNAFTNSWNGGGAKSISSIFWSENGIGILHNNQISGYIMQGLVVDGFHICSGNTLSNIQLNGDFFPTCPGGFETVGNYTYDQLIKKLQSKTPLYWWNATQYAGTFLAIIYDDFYFSIGINGYGSSQTHLNGNFVSQDLGFSDSLTYSGINWNNNNIWVRPGFHGGGGDLVGDTTGVINTNVTGDYVYGDCSWKDVLIVLETEGYNKYVCYGGLDDFSLYDPNVNYNPVAGQGLSIADIRGRSGSRAWDNFPEWFMFWNGIYRDQNNNYNAMWSSYPAVYYTYFQLYNAYKGSMLDPRTVLEYCQLRTLSGSVLNNSAGGYFKPVCETVIREKQTGLWNARLDGTIYSGGVYTGDVPLSVNWSGVGNMSGNVVQTDGIKFIQDFFNQAKSKITTDYSGNFIGIIPNYIIIFLLAIILFRFISH